MKNTIIIVLCLFMTLSCGEKQNENNNPEDTIETKTFILKDETEVRAKIVSFLTGDYLKNDIDFMSESDRMYAYNLFDLNNDGVDEIFVGLISPYFCGTGGCTMLILNSDFTLNSKITVVDFPIYISSETTNGWNNLIIMSDEKYHIMKFDGSKYPHNPSIEKVVDINNYSDKIELLTDAYENKLQF